MDSGLLVLIALILVTIFGTKLMSLFYKAKVDQLVKEDETLKSKQTILEKEARELVKKLNEPVKDLTPEQIEDFWNEDKK